MYVVSFLILMLPVLLAALISLHWHRMSFARRCFVFAALPSLAYFAVAWWIADEIHRYTPPAHRPLMQLPWRNAAEFGALALLTGAVATGLIHLYIRRAPQSP